MSINRLFGILIICMSLMGIVIVFQLAQITQQIDALSGSSYTKWTKYITPSFYVIIIVTITIGIKLMKKKK
jgi:hypothetical protein